MLDLLFKFFFLLFTFTFTLTKLILTIEDLSILSCGCLYYNFKNLNMSCSFLNILSTGILFLSAAVFSIIASIYHNAPITYSSLSAELIFSSMAFISAYMFSINYK